MSTKPVLDNQKLYRITARINRQKKLLKTNNCDTILSSIKRSEILKRQIILDYLKQLALYALQNNAKANIPSLIDCGALSETSKDYRFIKAEWGSYYNIYKRLKRQTKH